MTSKDKELLFKDLCCRLPYKVKVQSYNHEDIETIETLYSIDSDNYMSTIECDTLKNITKPYLFPLSSMTEEQKEEFNRLYTYDALIVEPQWKLIDWLNKNHFDYRGLIPKNLAIDATNLNIY